MRKRTLAGVSFFLSFVIIYGFTYVVASYGFRMPFMGLVSHLVASLIFAPILLIPLSRLNQSLLAWRKGRGRDIELEEKHEIGDSDIISLRPRRDDDGRG